MDNLSRDIICRYLRHTNVDVTVAKCVPSTNTELKIAADAGAKEGTVLAVDSQSAGRGRVGKSFFSPNGGLYLSIILRPDLEYEKSLLITTCAAVTTAEAIKEVLGLDVGIKWVNDLFYNEKKVCGILTEAPFDAEKGRVKYAVLGIGINVFESPDGYGEFFGVAGALVKDKVDGEVKSRLAAAVVDKFFDRYNNLSNENILDEYRRRLFIVGHNVSVVKGGETEKMRVLDVDTEFNLILEDKYGEKITMSSGEISIIPM